MQQQRQQNISRLTPKRIDPGTPRHKEALYTGKIRVYADQQYRAQNLRWQERVAAELDAVNQYLIPAYGLRLTIVDMLPWQRQQSGDDLETAMAELEALDGAADVDWVLGLISALSSATSSFHQLGVARPMGQHMLLRGYSDIDERKQIRRILDGVEQSRVDRLLDERRWHQRTALMMHEWAHTLGAMHLTGEGHIMSGNYDPQASTFHPSSDGLIREVLPVRMQKPRTAAHQVAQARVLQSYVGGTDFAGWVASERQTLLDFAAGLISDASGDTATADASRAAGALPEEARAPFANVQALVRQKSYARAQEELGQLITAYPAHIELRLAACRISLAESGPSDQAKARCARVGQLDPYEIGGELLLAQALYEADRIGEAGAILAQARDRIAKQGAGSTLRASPDLDPSNGRSEPAASASRASASRASASWQQLMTLYRQMKAVTWSEEAIAKAPAGADPAPFSLWATQMRHRYGLPPARGRRKPLVAIDQEGKYLDQVRQILNRVYAKDYAAARQEARAAERAYPRAPGIASALCDLELRQQNFAAARRHCQRALRSYERGSWAHYLLGIIALRERKNAAGIRHLQRAIALDPELRQAYHALGKAYDRRGDSDGRKRLAEAYEGRFGQPLPK